MQFCLEVSGPLALFTRPELKVERVSYDVITPSAARNIFKAIYWIPQFRWEISKIEVLKPIKHTAIRRNEIKSKIPTRALLNGIPPDDYHASGDRTQRNSCFLRDVKYRIHARVISDSQHETKKAAFIFERRARKGQCVWQPYLGTRECSAYFKLIKLPVSKNETAPISVDLDLGIMLYDMNFMKNITKPLLYRAELKQGIIFVPRINSSEIIQ